MLEMYRRDFLKSGIGALLASSTVLSPWSTLLAGEKASFLVKGEPPQSHPGSFTIAVLPDIQNYFPDHCDLLQQQVQWVIDQKEARNIACVLHLGDFTNHNSPPEWEFSREALSPFYGTLPFFFVPGNHDYSEEGKCTDRKTLLNDYFPITDFQDQKSFGGTYDKEPERMENSFHSLDLNGRKILFLCLEFGPRNDVVRWANDVVAAHGEHEVVLVTHTYMNNDNAREDWRRYGNKRSSAHRYPLGKNSNHDMLDGEELWQNLVTRHENFILTLNGHIAGSGLGKLSSQTPGGRDVHQLLVNFQMKPNGGNGWLRLLEFRPDGKTVCSYDYSPSLDLRNESPENQFTMNLSGVPAVSVP